MYCLLLTPEDTWEEPRKGEGGRGRSPLVRVLKSEVVKVSVKI